MDFDDHEPRSAETPSWSSSAPPSFSAPAVGELEEVGQPRRRRPLGWIVGVALVVLVVGATLVFTTTGSTKKSAIVLLREAPARTTGSGTARITGVVTATADGSTMTLMRQEAAHNFAQKTTTLSMSTGSGSEILAIRQVAGVSYVSIPAKFGELPGGAHWVSLTDADVKVDPRAAASVGSGDPSSGLAFMSAIDGDPRVVDREPLDGASATHYAFTLNLQPLVDLQGKAASALGNSAYGSMMEKLKGLVDITKLPGEAWIDSQGRVRRFTISMTITQGSETGKVSMDLRFSHFDEQVDVTAPDATDTVPFRQVPTFFATGAVSSPLSG